MRKCCHECVIIIAKDTINRIIIPLSTFIILTFTTTTTYAQKTYTPSQVFSGIHYANTIIDKLLIAKEINNISPPRSREKAIKPMHVYELHASVLHELYHYANKHHRRPPPLVVSTPMKYSPTDVFYLTQLIVTNLEELYIDEMGDIDFTSIRHKNKTPSDVYQTLFVLYYKLNRLNGKEKISPNEVFSHIYRAKEDLQSTLLTLSQRLESKHESQKRLLVTATYGTHSNGETLTAKEKNKTPSDVMSMVLNVRDNLNKLRKYSKLSAISPPSLTAYKKIKPIDIFLQTQFIIAELNLLKIPLNISTITNNAKKNSGKTPSDVFQEMKHINYMLDRLINTL